MKQTCIKCETTLPIANFEWQENRPSPRKICKTCRYPMRDREKEKARHRIYMKERRKNDPDAVRMNWERSVYGVCKEDIGAEKCMICGADDRLCIDHDHSTKAVRGILCLSCNLGLGSFKDDPEKLKMAIKYLESGPHFQLPWKDYP